MSPVPILPLSRKEFEAVRAEAKFLEREDMVSRLVATIEALLEGEYPDQPGCSHFRCVPPFDPVAARLLEAEEVRLRWPRFEGPCPDCGELVIWYASPEHFIAGDW